MTDRSYKNYTLKKELFNAVPNMTIVPVSEWLGRIVKQSFLQKYPVKIIQNGIDLHTFSPQPLCDTENMMKKLGIPGNAPILLGVASTWDQRKGLADFIRLSQIIPSDWRIVLVGLTKKQLKLLPANITGMERTENVRQLATLYTMSTVFINPTWEDTFPTTNLESMACGTPVITYNTGGSVESVSGETGYVVEKGDIQALKERTSDILKNTKESYKNACLDRAAGLYDKNNRFEDYIQLYNNLLGRTKK